MRRASDAEIDTPPSHAWASCAGCDHDQRESITVLRREAFARRRRRRSLRTTSSSPARSPGRRVCGTEARGGNAEPRTGLGQSRESERAARTWPASQSLLLCRRRGGTLGEAAALRTIRQRPLGLNDACAVGKGGLHKQGGDRPARRQMRGGLPPSLAARCAYVERRRPPARPRLSV